MNDYHIKVFTRSINYELYCFSKHLITLPYERVRLTGTYADEYLYKIITDTECDIAINIDEDAFVMNEQAIIDLIQFVIENDYANAGVADGGEVPIRNHNPIVTNPFFNVLNLRLIRTKFKYEAVINFDYKQHFQEMKNKLPKQLLNFEKGFESIGFEPYYPFFFWLAYQFKTLYLPTIPHKDGLTTILMNQNNIPMVYHTWYARFYKNEKDAYHTKRILSVINDVSAIRNIPVQLSVWERVMIVFSRICNAFDAKRSCLRMRIKKGPKYYIKKWLI